MKRPFDYGNLPYCLTTYLVMQLVRRKKAVPSGTRALRHSVE